MLENNLIPKDGEDEKIVEDQEIIYNNVKLSVITNKSLLFEGGIVKVAYTTLVSDDKTSIVLQAAVPEGTYEINNNVGTILKSGVSILYELTIKLY